MSSITSSGVAIQESLCPLWPCWPPGFLPLVLQRVFVFLTISSFIGSLLGWVLLLPEFFSESSYLDKRSFNSVISSFFYGADDSIILCYDSICNLRILLVDSFTHRPYLFCHVLLYLWYIHNLLFHRCKGTKNICDVQKCEALICLTSNIVSSDFQGQFLWKKYTKCYVE